MDLPHLDILTQNNEILHHLPGKIKREQNG